MKIGEHDTNNAKLEKLDTGKWFVKLHRTEEYSDVMKKIS